MAFWIFVVLVAMYVAAAGYTDLRMQRIPNYLTVPAAIAGLVCSLAFKFWPPPGDRFPTEPSDCLLGFALGFAIFFLPFLLRGGGPGDLKLVAALGAWLGWLHLILALAISLVFAMLLMFVVWATGFSVGGARSGKATVPARAGSTGGGSKPKARRRRAVPFAIPVALGTWCILAEMILKNLR